MKKVYNIKLKRRKRNFRKEGERMRKKFKNEEGANANKGEKY